MNKDEVALQIFCALMSRPESKVSTGAEPLGADQVKVSFMLADTFMTVRNDKMKGEQTEQTDFTQADGFRHSNR